MKYGEGVSEASAKGKGLVGPDLEYSPTRFSKKFVLP